MDRTSPLRGTSYENITVDKTRACSMSVGFPGAEISGVRIRNSTFNDVTKGDLLTEPTSNLLNCQIKKTAK